MHSLRQRFHKDGNEDTHLKEKLQQPPNPAYTDPNHGRNAAYPQTRIDPSTLANPQSNRRSIDVVDAANSARRDVWKPLDASEGRTSTEAKRSSMDLVDAANVARKSRGEHRLPVEPARMDIIDPGYTSRTRAGSVPRYAPPGGEAARANAAVETIARRSSLKNNRLSQDSQTGYNEMTPSSSPSRAIQRKPIPTTEGAAGSTTYKARNAPVMDNTTQRVLHGMDEIRPLVPPKDAPAVPPKSNRRSIDGSIIGGYSRIPSPAPVTQMDIFKPDGTLHDRYTTNTEDVERLGEQFSKAVIHEKIVPTIHNVITTAISRDIHTHEIRQHVLPVTDKRFLPERHWVQTADGRFVEVDPEEVEAARQKYAYATRVEESVSAVRIEGQPFDQIDDFPDHYFRMST